MVVSYLDYYYIGLLNVYNFLNILSENMKTRLNNVIDFLKFNFKKGDDLNTNKNNHFIQNTKKLDSLYESKLINYQMKMNYTYKEYNPYEERFPEGFFIRGFLWQLDDFYLRSKARIFPYIDKFSYYIREYSKFTYYKTIDTTSIIKYNLVKYYNKLLYSNNEVFEYNFKNTIAPDKKISSIINISDFNQYSFNENIYKYYNYLDTNTNKLLLNILLDNNKYNSEKDIRLNSIFKNNSHNRSVELYISNIDNIFPFNSSINYNNIINYINLKNSGSCYLNYFEIYKSYYSSKFNHAISPLNNFLYSRSDFIDYNDYSFDLDIYKNLKRKKSKKETTELESIEDLIITGEKSELKYLSNFNNSDNNISKLYLKFKKDKNNIYFNELEDLGTLFLKFNKSNINFNNLVLKDMLYSLDKNNLNNIISEHFFMRSNIHKKLYKGNPFYMEKHKKGGFKGTKAKSYNFHGEEQPSYLMEINLSDFNLIQELKYSLYTILNNGNSLNRNLYTKASIYEAISNFSWPSYLNFPITDLSSFFSFSPLMLLLSITGLISVSIVNFFIKLSSKTIGMNSTKKVEFLNDWYSTNQSINSQQSNFDYKQVNPSTQHIEGIKLKLIGTEYHGNSSKSLFFLKKDLEYHLKRDELYNSSNYLSNYFDTSKYLFNKLNTNSYIGRSIYKLPNYPNEYSFLINFNWDTTTYLHFLDYKLNNLVYFFYKILFTSDIFKLFTILLYDFYNIIISANLILLFYNLFFSIYFFFFIMLVLSKYLLSLFIFNFHIGAISSIYFDIIAYYIHNFIDFIGNNIYILNVRYLLYSVFMRLYLLNSLLLFNELTEKIHILFSIPFIVYTFTYPIEEILNYISVYYLDHFKYFHESSVKLEQTKIDSFNNSILIFYHGILVYIFYNTMNIVLYLIKYFYLINVIEIGVVIILAFVYLLYKISFLNMYRKYIWFYRLYNIKNKNINKWSEKYKLFFSFYETILFNNYVKYGSTGKVSIYNYLRNYKYNRINKEKSSFFYWRQEWNDILWREAAFSRPKKRRYKAITKINNKYNILNNTYIESPTNQEYYSRLFKSSNYTRVKAKYYREMYTTGVSLFSSSTHEGLFLYRKYLYTFPKFINNLDLFTTKEEYLIPLVLMGKLFYDGNYNGSRLLRENTMHLVLKNAYGKLKQEPEEEFYQLRKYRPFLYKAITSLVTSEKNSELFSYSITSPKVTSISLKDYSKDNSKHHLNYLLWDGGSYNFFFIPGISSFSDLLIEDINEYGIFDIYNAIEYEFLDEEYSEEETSYENWDEPPSGVITMLDIKYPWRTMINSKHIMKRIDYYKELMDYSERKEEYFYKDDRREKYSPVIVDYYTKRYKNYSKYWYNNNNLLFEYKYKLNYYKSKSSIPYNTYNLTDFMENYKLELLLGNIGYLYPIALNKIEKSTFNFSFEWFKNVTSRQWRRGSYKSSVFFSIGTVWENWGQLNKDKESLIDYFFPLDEYSKIFNDMDNMILHYKSYYKKKVRTRKYWRYRHYIHKRLWGKLHRLQYFKERSRCVTDLIWDVWIPEGGKHYLQSFFGIGRMEYKLDLRSIEMDRFWLNKVNFFKKLHKKMYKFGYLDEDKFTLLHTVKGDDTIARRVLHLYSYDLYFNLSLYNSFFVEFGDVCSDLYNIWNIGQYANKKNLNFKYTNFNLSNYTNTISSKFTNFSNYDYLDDEFLLEDDYDNEPIFDLHAHWRVLNTPSRFDITQYRYKPEYQRTEVLWDPYDYRMEDYLKNRSSRKILNRGTRGEGAKMLNMTGDFARENYSIFSYSGTPSLIKDRMNLYSSLIYKRDTGFTVDGIYNQVDNIIENFLVEKYTIDLYHIPESYQDNYIELNKSINFSFYNNENLNDLREEYKKKFGGSWKYNYLHNLIENSEYDYLFENSLKNRTELFENYDYKLLKLYSENMITGSLINNESLIYNEKLKSISPNASIFFQELYNEYSWEIYEYDEISIYRDDFFIIVPILGFFFYFIIGKYYDLKYFRFLHPINLSAPRFNKDRYRYKRDTVKKVQSQYYVTQSHNILNFSSISADDYKKDNSFFILDEYMFPNTTRNEALRKGKINSLKIKNSNKLKKVIYDGKYVVARTNRKWAALNPPDITKSKATALHKRENTIKRTYRKAIQNSYEYQHFLDLHKKKYDVNYIKSSIINDYIGIKYSIKSSYFLIRALLNTFIKHISKHDYSLLDLIKLVYYVLNNQSLYFTRNINYLFKIGILDNIKSIFHKTLLDPNLSNLYIENIVLHKKYRFRYEHKLWARIVLDYIIYPPIKYILFPLFSFCVKIFIYLYDIIYNIYVMLKYILYMISYSFNYIKKYAYFKKIDYVKYRKKDYIKTINLFQMPSYTKNKQYYNSVSSNNFLFYNSYSIKSIYDLFNSSNKYIFSIVLQNILVFFYKIMTLFIYIASTIVHNIILYISAVIKYIIVLVYPILKFILIIIYKLFHYFKYFYKLIYYISTPIIIIFKQVVNYSIIYILKYIYILIESFKISSYIIYKIIYFIIKLSKIHLLYSFNLLVLKEFYSFILYKLVKVVTISLKIVYVYFYKYIYSGKITYLIYKYIYIFIYSLISYLNLLINVLNMNLMINGSNFYYKIQIKFYTYAKTLISKKIYMTNYKLQFISSNLLSNINFLGSITTFIKKTAMAVSIFGKLILNFTLFAIQYFVLSIYFMIHPFTLLIDFNMAIFKNSVIIINKIFFLLLKPFIFIFSLMSFFYYLFKYLIISILEILYLLSYELILFTSIGFHNLKLIIILFIKYIIILLLSIVYMVLMNIVILFTNNTNKGWFDNINNIIINNLNILLDIYYKLFNFSRYNIKYIIYHIVETIRDFVYYSAIYYNVIISEIYNVLNYNYYQLASVMDYYTSIIYF